MNRLSFTVIDGGRVDPPMPRERPPLSDDGSAARRIAVGMALSFPVWCGLVGFAWWAWVVTGSCGK